MSEFPDLAGMRLRAWRSCLPDQNVRKKRKRFSMPTGQHRIRTFWPKQLNLYHECPERYFHERIERRKGEVSSNLAMTKGIAAHQVLGDIADHYRNHGAVPSDLSERTRKALPRSEYPSEESWVNDLETAAQEVEYGTTVFDGNGTVLASEQTFKYLYKHGRSCPPFELAARVDLVMLRDDDEGKPFLDVMDFKGGAGKDDLIQRLASRIVVKNHADEVGFGVPFDYIQNSTVLTGQGATRSVKLDLDDLRRGWELIKKIVGAIIDAADWHPIRSPLCEYCPYYIDGCSIAPDPDGPDELGEWLDGVDV
jgi:PD-(D/E)XK nuclease superfamily